MIHEVRKIVILGMIAGTLLAPDFSRAGADEPEALPMQAPIAIQSLDDLVSLSAPQLDQLYRQSEPGTIPTGKVRGRALYPDARFPRAKSNAARLAWQGKVFQPETSTAINKFFGVRAVRGNVYSGTSWLDGRPSMILDYEGTSKILGNYRDEFRQVAPGLFLGLMHDRTVSPPSLKMYFALDEH